MSCIIHKLQFHSATQKCIMLQWSVEQVYKTHEDTFTIYLLSYDEKYDKYTEKMSWNRTLKINNGTILYDCYEFIPTGIYIIRVENKTTSCEVTVIIPAIAILSTGGSCFLVDGRSVGLNLNAWYVITNHHALPTFDHALSTNVTFNDVIVTNLRPDIFWKTSTNKGNIGLDYSCIAIDEATKHRLLEMKIYPNPIINQPKECEKNLMLIHRPRYANQVLHTLCRVVAHKEVKTQYDYLGPVSGGGSSGSPVFGVDTNTRKVGVCGLHKARFTCVNLPNIIADICKVNADIVTFFNI